MKENVSLSMFDQIIWGILDFGKGCIVRSEELLDVEFVRRKKENIKIVEFCDCWFKMI